MRLFLFGALFGLNLYFMWHESWFLAWLCVSGLLLFCKIPLEEKS